MNKTGPGQAVFLQCDMTKEEEIKVREYWPCLYVITIFLLCMCVHLYSGIQR